MAPIDLVLGLLTGARAIVQHPSAYSIACLLFAGAHGTPELNVFITIGLTNAAKANNAIAQAVVFNAIGSRLASFDCRKKAAMFGAWHGRLYGCEAGEKAEH